MDRRSFMLAASSACLLGQSEALAAAPVSGAVRRKLHSFDYRGVRLLPSRLTEQTAYARNLYFNLPNDDLLKGFRRKAGLPAPGQDMLGWCKNDCAATFGQWISGMARLSCATGDTALRDKAILLTTEWEKTLGRDGDPHMGTYPWEKMACGLVDLALYADYPHAIEILEKITRWASTNFDRSRSPAIESDRDGRRPKGTLEWYTLAENTLRAYELTGNKMFLEFANLWLYPDYWNKFVTSSNPDGVALLHSYSHVNTFSSAAMVYEVTGDPRYLAILRNAYDWTRKTQAYASGGFGPGEWTMPANGGLGDALDVRLDTAEIPCGSWAGFKLSRYLMGFTGEARYGDWIETLLYNGIGAALPLQPDGRAYYYADYRVGMGTKTYFWDEWPCCSGTYIQAIADYHNIIYFRDEAGVYVNLAVPSTLEWEHEGQRIRLAQQTTYPDAEETRLAIALDRPAAFALRVRVPSWCRDMTVAINGKPAAVTATPNDWAELRRTWTDGDVVTVRFPMRPRLVPVDAQHPNRVAVLHGPVQMVQDARFSFPLFGTREELASRLERRPGPLKVHVTPKAGPGPDKGGQQVGELRPFYDFNEREPYRSYFDIDKPRFI